MFLLLVSIISAISSRRLPRHVVPQFYDLNLAVSFESFTFTGRVEIAIDVKEATKQILLNAHQLEVFNATIGDKTTSAAVSFDVEQQLLILDFADPIPTGRHNLIIEYKGILNDELAGFYRTKEIIDGKTNWALVTQFEACDARRALPCWDEPDRKARFQLTMTAPSSKQVLSNTHVISTVTNEDGTSTTQFDKTPVMSTYLLAFIVGNYDQISEDVDGVKVSVYTPLGQSHLGQFSLYCAIKSLRFFVDYFAIPYPLTKLDMVAVPDFAAGAMENWGLVTYRSTKILSEENASFEQKKSNARTIAHEIAHHWFGNLVTMEWWTHLWLNEGFARFCEHIAVDSIFPEWKVWDHFMKDVLELAMSLDALDSSHPIEIPVQHPSEIDEIFDAISYAKGGSVIRMLQLWIGEENFRKGLQQYLTKFAYSNALTEDLWAELGKASGFPVHDVMSCWTSTMGFPMISVEIAKWEGRKLTLKLSQSKFANGDTQTTWKIPVSYITQSNQTHTIFIMDNQEMELNVDLEKGEWIKFNSNGVGFYRVNYSGELKQSLHDSLSTLDTRNRFNFLADLDAFSRWRIVPVVEYLNAISALNNETNYIILDGIASGLAKINKFKQKLGFEEKFKEFRRNLFAPAYSSMTFGEEKDVTDGLLQALLIGILGNSDHEQTVKYAAEQYQRMVTDISSVKADLRLPIAKVAVKKLDSLSTLEHIYNTASTAMDQSIAEKSLCKLPTSLLDEGLAFLLRDEMRPANAIHGVLAFKQNNEGRQLLWNMILTKHAWLAKLPNNLTAAFHKHVLSSFDSKEQLQQAREFYTANPIAQKRSVEQGFEAANVNMAWLEQNGDELVAYFK